MKSPYLIDWAITNRCNLECLHCRGMADVELDGGALLRVAEEIPSLNPRWVILEGGEVLLRGELFEMIEILRRNDVKVYLISNGMLLDRPTARKLADLDANLMISIDGADRKSYERTRKGASFDRLKESVALAAEHHILDSCPVTIGKHNHRQIGELFAFVKEIGYAKITILGLKPCKDYGEYALNGAEYEALFFSIIELQKTHEMDVYVDEPFFKPFLKEHNIRFSTDAENGIVVPEISRCIFGEYMFIETNGDVKPCTFAPVVMGNVEERPLGEIWAKMRDSELVREITDLSKRASPCSECDYLNECGGCRSRTFALTGSWTASDPSCPLKGAQP